MSLDRGRSLRSIISLFFCLRPRISAIVCLLISRRIFYLSDCARTMELKKRSYYLTCLVLFLTLTFLKADNEFKFVALVSYSSEKSYTSATKCTGSLITATRILVAASCIKPSDNVVATGALVACGSDDMAIYDGLRKATPDYTTALDAAAMAPVMEKLSKEVNIHSDYKPAQPTIVGNIAVIVVAEDFVGPIALVPLSESKY